MELGPGKSGTLKKYLYMFCRECLVSLASTINGMGTTAQVCRSDTVEVTLYSRSCDFGFNLQGGVFTTEILGSPAVIGFIEPGGKADK